MSVFGNLIRPGKIDQDYADIPVVVVLCYISSSLTNHKANDVIKEMQWMKITVSKLKCMCTQRVAARHQEKRRHLNASDVGTRCLVHLPNLRWGNTREYGDAITGFHTYGNFHSRQYF